jgi:hypothetical protein
MPNTEQCRGPNCKSTELIKAHIIPAGFGRLIKGDGPNMTVSLEKVSTAKAQLGEFDPGILCKDCDHALGIFDDYAVEVCESFERKHRRLPDRLFEMDNFDGDKFAKFVLAVLWRASISKRKSFSQVALGPYENTARDVLFGRMALQQLHAFEVLVQRYESEHIDLKGIYSLPVRSPFGELNAYGFSLTGFRILAKLDNRPINQQFRPFTINGNNILRGFFIEFEKTQEWTKIKEIAGRHL